MGAGKRGTALEGTLWLVPLPPHPSKSQRAELFFHPSFKECLKVDRGPAEGGARSHPNRLGPVWPTRFTSLREEVARRKRRRSAESKDLAEASSTGGKSREAEEFWVPGQGEGRGGRGGSRAASAAYLSRQSRAAAPPLRSARVSRRDVLEGGAGAGPARLLGRALPTPPRARCRLPPAVPPSTAAGRATPARRAA